MRKLIFCITSLLITYYGICWPAIINIPADYPTIQQGIDAGIDGDTVLVQPGTYVENINFNGHNIVLASLFLTTEDTSYISQTIIDGDSSGSVVTFNHQEDSTAILVGFSITNGLGWEAHPFYYAGGITCHPYSNPKIAYNYIFGNFTSGYSRFGAIYSWGASPIISHNILYNNDDYTITCHSQDTTVSYPPKIEYNLIVNNHSYREGIYCWQSSPLIRGNTISRNDGIRCREASPIIQNTLIWFPTSGDIIVLDLSSYPIVSYSNIQGGWEGIGNISYNPMFLDPYNGDFNVCSQSPCIDAGDPALTDPDGSRSDIGLYYPDHPDCPGGNIWYVSVTGDDTTGDGSIGNPFRTIQHAVDISVSLDTVLVLPGTYSEYITTGDKSITLASNYILSQDTMDIVNTVIDGDTLILALIDMQSNTGYSQLIGMTVKYCHAGSILAYNARIANNTFEFNGSWGIRSTSSEIIGNTFRYNNGFAVIDGLHGSIIGGNTFYDNTADFLVSADYILVENNIIYRNECIIFWSFMGGTSVFNGNLIYNNHVSTGYTGGIFHTQDSKIIATGNTICYNTGTGNPSYLGIFGNDHGSQPPVFADNIIWGNSYANFDTLLFYEYGDDPIMTYCDVQGGWPGEGNIECDPQFCDPDSGNFYLLYNSCCVGAGQNGENMGVYGVGCWSPCDTYVVGDVNGSGTYDGLDIMYGVAFLKGGPTPTVQCECTEGNILYPAGDVNNSCSYNGLDITYGVAYFKGGSTPVPCQDCPPVLYR